MAVKNKKRKTHKTQFPIAQGGQFSHMPSLPHLLRFPSFSISVVFFMHPPLPVVFSLVTHGSYSMCIPSGVSKGDVTLEPGRLFFSGACWGRMLSNKGMLTIQQATTLPPTMGRVVRQRQES